MRRTTSVDSTRPRGVFGDIEVDARARDLTTGPGSAVEAVDQRITATLGVDRTILAIEADPPEPGVDRLVGMTVGPGFRGRMAAALPDHAAGNTLLHTLLDDLPGAALVSGYAMQRAEDSPIPENSPPDGPFAQHIRASEDMCAGWAVDATIIVTFRDRGTVPTPMGPKAPPLEREGDPLSWHTIAPLAPEATRRRRRIDLLPPTADGPGWTFDSHFRDSYCDVDGTETAVHEYVVDGWIDTDGPRIGGVQAEACVLPWVECPGALASVPRLVGRPLANLRREVRAEFVGTTTCTHLNDSFRVLADLLPLLDRARGADGPGSPGVATPLAPTDGRP